MFLAIRRRRNLPLEVSFGERGRPSMNFPDMRTKKLALIPSRCYSPLLALLTDTPIIPPTPGPRALSTHF